MLKLGITGGLGSGKSVAAEYFREKGAFIFNADEESKKYLRQSISLQKKLIDVFGRTITTDNKELDFTALSKIAFSQTTNQKTLNSIIWPEVFLLIKNAQHSATKQNFDLFIVEAALLIEAKYFTLFDHLLLITAEQQIRLDRAIQRKSISREQILQRMKLQMPEAEKRIYADTIIENNYSIDELYKNLEMFYQKIKG